MIKKYQWVLIIITINFGGIYSKNNNNNNNKDDGYQTDESDSLFEYVEMVFIG